VTLEGISLTKFRWNIKFQLKSFTWCYDLKNSGYTLFHKPFIVIFFNRFILKKINGGLIFVYKKL